MQSSRGFSTLITGGGSGLGAGIARHLVAQGGRVTISGRTGHKLDAIAAELGPLCATIQGDVTNSADRVRMIEVARAHGDGLQGVVHCAGNMLRGTISELAPHAILDLLNSNVAAAMALTGLAVPHLAKDGGAVLFVGSVHSRRAFPGASAYAATKGSVETVSRVLAAELGPHKIRVNCVLPGAVPSDLNVRAGFAMDAEDNLERLHSMMPEHPLGRIGTPQDIAEAADYLLRATWTTGASLVVDGGLSLGVTHK